MAKSVSEPPNSTVAPPPPSSSLKSRKSPRSKNGGKSSGETNFFYQSHYVSGLIALIGFLVYLSYRAPNLGQNSHIMYSFILPRYFKFIFSGFAAASVSFIFIGTFMFQSGPFIRPHPLFWRLILAMSVLYLLVIIFLLFQVKTKTTSY